MRKLAVVTVGRSDYGIYLPILRRIEANPRLSLCLIVSGMHLSPEFGLTAQIIEKDGFKIGDKVEMLLSSDTPEGIAKSMGLGLIGFSQSYARLKPDMIIVLGDRFEMHAAALAALPFCIPVAHIHGGELTLGAMDDALRHSITKLSHLHFASTELYARRIIQLGEEPWRVVVSGAPSLDNLTKLLSREELETNFGVDLTSPPLLVTFHPVTLEHEKAAYQTDELLAALEACHMPVIFTLPNADTGGRVIIEKIRKAVQEHPLYQLVENLGTIGYFSMMACAAAMVGNSSSGIVEAASFKLPVVNIGTRQEGRLHPENVIDTGYERTEILKAIHKAISPSFQLKIKDLVNPYGNGQAAEIIVQHLENIPLNERLLKKKFYDLTANC